MVVVYLLLVFNDCCMCINVVDVACLGFIELSVICVVGF